MWFWLYTRHEPLVSLCNYALQIRVAILWANLNRAAASNSNGKTSLQPLFFDIKAPSLRNVSRREPWLLSTLRRVISPPTSPRRLVADVFIRSPPVLILLSGFVYCWVRREHTRSAPPPPPDDLLFAEPIWKRKGKVCVGEFSHWEVKEGYIFCWIISIWVWDLISWTLELFRWQGWWVRMIDKQRENETGVRQEAYLLKSWFLFHDGSWSHCMPNMVLWTLCISFLKRKATQLSSCSTHSPLTLFLTDHTAVFHYYYVFLIYILNNLYALILCF